MDTVKFFHMPFKGIFLDDHIFFFLSVTELY